MQEFDASVTARRLDSTVRQENGECVRMVEIVLESERCVIEFADGTTAEPVCAHCGNRFPACLPDRSHELLRPAGDGETAVPVSEWKIARILLHLLWRKLLLGVCAVLILFCAVGCDHSLHESADRNASSKFQRGK